MSWLKSKWTMLAVFGVLTIVVLVLLFVGISTHTEAGLMRVCWDERGNARYTECRGPMEDLVWTQGMPVRLAVHAYSGNPDDLEVAQETVADAADLWNTQLGFEAIKIVQDTSANATLTWGAPSTRSRQGGYVSHIKSNLGTMSAKVDIIHIATLRLSYLATVHELGHLLGLAHDDYESSPMCPVTSDFMGIVQVSGWDRALLRARYHP